MDAEKYNLIVIGSGPGGYVGAIRGAQLGLKVAVIEKEAVGGVCLNVGCIPSKSLIHSAELYRSQKELNSYGIKTDISEFDYGKVFKQSRTTAAKLSKGVQYLLKKNNIDLVTGNAVITGKNEVTVDRDRILSADNILIATGSRPKTLGFLPDDERIMTSTDFLMMQELPASLAILGAGAIGVEFASVMNSFGVDVTIIEMLDNILPLEDSEVVGVLRNSLNKRGVKIFTGTKAKEFKLDNKTVNITIETAKGEQVLSFDKLLVAVGRTPNSEDLGLESLGIAAENGFIKVGDYYETEVPGIYAIGDVIKSPLLAHVASKEAEIAVERIAGLGGEKRIDESLVPSAVYCEPQVARFGPTETEIEASGSGYRKSVFPFRAIGKAVASQAVDGMVKILAEKSTGKIISAHISGNSATELIHELLLARKSGLLCSDIEKMIHAHPTLSEGIMEAARGIDGTPIHM